MLAGENEQLSDAAKAVLRQALDDGTSFLRTLQNILDLWRIKQGELPVEAQEVNFREVVEEAIFSVQDTLEGKERRDPQGDPRAAAEDPHRPREGQPDPVPAARQRGEVHAARARSTSSRASSGDQLVCEIRDTGIGICPDDQQFIFDEFYQVDDLASTKYRGSGLGLALVRDLLILLDGEIELSSEVGQGTPLHLPRSRCR